MKLKIIKKITVMIMFFGCLIIKETHAITAAQAARQQQISAEIEKILIQKVDESNYNKWIKEINEVVNKYKDVNLPDIQTKIKSLQNIAAIQNKQESVEKKVEETNKYTQKQIEEQLDVFLKKQINEYVTLNLYEKLQRDIKTSFIPQGKALNIPELNEKIKKVEAKFKQIDELRKNQPKGPPTSNLNEPGLTPLTKEEQKLLKEIADLKQEGEVSFEKVLKDEILRKNFNDNAFQIWKNKAEDLIEKSSNTKQKSIVVAAGDLNNVLDSIEMLIKKEKSTTPIPTSPTGNIPPTSNLNTPLTAEEQKIIQEIKELLNKSKSIDRSGLLAAWINQIGEIFQTHGKSTSKAIKAELDQLRGRIQELEIMVYKTMNEEYNTTLYFTSLNSNEYDLWKGKMKSFINDFYKLFNLAVGINAPTTQNLLDEVKKIEQEILNEDKRRANLNLPSEKLTPEKQQKIEEDLTQINQLINASNDLTTLSNDERKTIIKPLYEFATYIATINKPSLEYNKLEALLVNVEKNLLAKSIDFIKKELNLLNVNVINLQEIVKEIKNKQMAQQKSKAIENILVYFNDATHKIYLIFDFLVKKENLDQSGSSSVYNLMLNNLFGSKNQGEDFVDGHPENKSSLYNALNELKNIIAEIYLKDPDKTSRQEYDFIELLYTNMLKLQKTNLIQLLKDLLNSQQLKAKKDAILNMIKLIENDEFYQHMANAYKN